MKGIDRPWGVWYSKYMEKVYEESRVSVAAWDNTWSEETKDWVRRIQKKALIDSLPFERPIRISAITYVIGGKANNETITASIEWSYDE